MKTLQMLFIILILGIVQITWSHATEVKITASDGEANDKFGSSVAISGDYAIVGAPYDDDFGDDSGSAYIFVRSGTNWTELQKVTASDGEANDKFGSSVAISGDYAIVGAPEVDAAYIFVRDGTSWTEQQKITASDGTWLDKFGYSVSICEDTAIVGAPYYGAGAAYIFVRSGTSWTEQQKIIASDGGSMDKFGSSVSISGNIAIVGAPEDDDLGSNSGSAYIYDFAPSSTPNITVSPDPIDFGDVIVGREITVTVSIGNTGAAELNVTDIGSDLGEILKIFETAFTVAPAATHDITLTMTAASAGEISGTLTITSNDPDSPTTEIAIIGNAKLRTFHFGDVSGDGSISAFDASLILRFVVGIIDRFPVDDMIGSSPENAPLRDYEVSIPQISLKAGQRVSVPVYINDVAGLASGGIKIRYDTTVLKAIEVMSPVSKSYYWKANTGLNGEVRFAFVNANASNKSDGLSKLDELLLIEFETLPDTEGKTSPLILEHVQLAESLSIKKINGLVTVLPGEFRLHQNYPNPFNPETWLPYQLAKDAVVTINIYNVKGQLIRTLHLGNQKAGTYMTRNKAAHWDGKDAVGEAVSSGIYFYQLQAGEFFATRKMVIMK